MRIIRVGSRASKLAVAQSQLLMQAISQAVPDVRLELVTMTTTGDRILDKTLDKIGGKGLFVKELDHALLSGAVDICIHSAKDLPAGENPALPVVAVSARADARDALVLPQGTAAPDTSLPLGSSSLRRVLQLRELYPHWHAQPVRGNVFTRLQKLDNGEYGGLVLAAAGLSRLGLEGRVSRIFSPEEVLPAACQGILAVQARAGEDVSFLQPVHDACAWDCFVAERAYIEALDGGCSSPVAAYAQVLTDGTLWLRGMYVSNAGALCKGQLSGQRGEAAKLGKQLAAQLRQQGEKRHG